ncbi:hypothetical protein ACFL1Z_02025 [Thermodesulfobacteriota bacterium]
MSRLYKFFIRLILSVAFALLIGTFFFEGNLLLKISGLAIVMLILSYIFEYTKRRDRRKDI